MPRESTCGIDYLLTTHSLGGNRRIRLKPGVSVRSTLKLREGSPANQFCWLEIRRGGCEGQLAEV